MCIMDFIEEYDDLKKVKLTCDIKNLFKINRIMMGQGGSHNIILDVTDKKNNKLIIKIIPEIIHFNVEKEPDYDQLEIKFYQFFTKKYLLTNRTPHIVGIYNHQKCTKIDTLINAIKKPIKCPTYEDKLIKKTKNDAIQEKLCALMSKYEKKLIKSEYDILLLEHCDLDFSDLIYTRMSYIKSVKPSAALQYVDLFIYELHRILFQIIFTLAIIKDDYPGFEHGDLFVRNILLSYESSYLDNDFVAYHYKNKIFYLPANGYYAKINDFGMTVILGEIEPNDYSLIKNLNKYYNKNPFNQKTDIFNLLHDIYDGQNLGTASINKLIIDNKIHPEKYKYLHQFLNRFIQTRIIDKINTNNPDLLDETWNIDSISILEKTVLTPSQYLLGKFFNEFSKLPKNSNVVNHYNKK